MVVYDFLGIGKKVSQMYYDDSLSKVLEEDEGLSQLIKDLSINSDATIYSVHRALVFNDSSPSRFRDLAIYLTFYRKRKAETLVKGLSKSDFKFYKVNSSHLPEFVYRSSDMVFVYVPEVNWKPIMSRHDLDAFEFPHGLVGGFLVSKTKITNGFWHYVMGGAIPDPSLLQCPIRNTDIDTCRYFCSKLGGRLPNGVEWDYLFRSRSTKYDYWRDKQLLVNDRSGQYKIGMTHPVGVTKPNGLGLHDMCENLWEFCDGTYEKDMDFGDGHIKYNIIGGLGFKGDIADCGRKAITNDFGIRNSNIGFRCIIDVDPR